MNWTAAVLLVAALCASAFAQDGDDAAEPAAPGASPTLNVTAQAVDYSAMLLSSGHGVSPSLEPIPIANAPVRLLVRAPGAGTTTLEATTDLAGKFTVDLGNPAPGAHAYFVIPADEETGRSGYWARPWVIDDAAPPDQLRFYRALPTQPAAVAQEVTQVVTVYDRDGPDDRAIQIRHIARFANQSPDFGVWTGPLTERGWESYFVPVPDGFEVRGVSVNGEPIEPEIVPLAHGGQGVVYREPIFPVMPGSAQGAMQMMVTMIADHPGSGSIDLSAHVEYYTYQYAVHVEQGQLFYEVTEDGKLALTNSGVNPPTGNTEKITVTWSAGDLPAHSDLSAVFSVDAPFPWHGVGTITMIVLLVIGAAALGLALSRRKGGATATKDDVEAPATGAARQLKQLQDRRDRGEITSVEYDIRSRALTASASGASQRRPTSELEPIRGGLAQDVDLILSRTEESSPEQLRADVRTLARAIQELLKRR